MSTIEPLLRSQWQTLRSWLADQRVLDQADESSGLGEWAVGDLVVHLGYGLRMIAQLTPAAGDEPLSIASYVAGYAPAREQIADDTSCVAAALRGRELDGVDELVAEAWAALDRGLPAVVLGRRGPVRAADFLLTRLIELVVHGDDLHRRLRPRGPSPVLPEAVAAVAAVLLDAHLAAAGRPPRWSGIELVRVATGRTTVDDPTWPLLR